MTDRLQEICRAFLLGGESAPRVLFLYGKGNEPGRLKNVLMVGFANLHLRFQICRELGQRLAWRITKGVPLTDLEGPEAEPPEEHLFIFGGLETIAGEDAWDLHGERKEREEERMAECTGAFEAAFRHYCGHGVRVLLDSTCPPDELPFLSDEIREEIKKGLVLCLDGEEISAPLEELAAMRLYSPPEKGRYREWYRPEFLELFFDERTETLSETQAEALGRLKRIVIELPEELMVIQRNQVRKNKLWWYYPNAPEEEIDADMLAFRIRYPFLNRFNCGPEGYEVDFARSGALGHCLRCLKEKDEGEI